MVNTFLVDSSYAKSASLLDKVRLANQRREALQILNNVIKLKTLGKLLNDPLPKDSYQWYSWIRKVISNYKNSPYLLILRQDNPSESIKEDYKPSWVIVFKDERQVSGCLLCLKSSTIFKIDKLKEGDKPIGFGFIYHPAILMWLGHENSLREYIDIHIEECLKRGIKNNMCRYLVRGHEQPSWTYDRDFLLRHRSNLFHKEIDRNEKPWYQTMPNIFEDDQLLPYFWPYTEKVSSKAGLDDSQKRYPIKN